MFMAGTSLAADLGLADHGYSPIELERPYGWMGADGETLILHRDLQRTLAEIRHFSPRDARKYAEIAPVLDWLVGLQVELGAQHPAEIRKIDLLRVAGQVGLDRTRRSFLAKMLTISIFELVSETFGSDAMRGLCAYWCSMFGPANLDGSGMYLVGFAAVHRGRGVNAGPGRDERVGRRDRLACRGGRSSSRAAASRASWSRRAGRAACASRTAPSSARAAVSSGRAPRSTPWGRCSTTACSIRTPRCRSR